MKTMRMVCPRGQPQNTRRRPGKTTSISLRSPLPPCPRFPIVRGTTRSPCPPDRESCSFPQGTALPAPRRDLQPQSALHAADADDAGGAGPAGAGGRDPVLVDEGIDDVDLGAGGRPGRHHRHHRHRRARLRAGGPLPRRGASPSCSAARTSTLVPDDAQPHADAIVVGYAEDDLAASCCATSPPGGCSRATTRRPDLSLAGRPFPRRDLLPRRALPHHQCLRGDARLRAQLRVLRRADGLGAQAVSRSRSTKSSPTSGSTGRAEAHLRRPEPDRRPRLRGSAVRGARSRCGVAVVRPRDRRCSPTTSQLLDLARAERVPRAADGARIASRRANLRDRPARASTLRTATREVVERLHARGIALQGCFVFGLDDDTPDVFLETAEFAVEARHRPAALRRRHAVPRHAALQAPGGRRAHPHAATGSCTTPSTSSSSRRRMSVRGAAARASRRPGSYAYSLALASAGGLRRTPQPAGRSPSAPTSATASTPTTCAASTTATGSCRPDRRRRPPRGMSRPSVSPSSIPASAGAGAKPLHPHLADGAAAGGHARRA